MEILLWVLVGALLLFGFLGCFINKFPGPICVLIAMVIAICGLEVKFGWGTIALVAVLAIGSIVLSKKLKSLAKKVQEFSKRAGWGTTIGSLVALGLCGTLSSLGPVLKIILAILLLIAIPFIFAYLLELTRKQGNAIALKCATSATVAYIADTFLKLIVFVYAVYALFMMN